MKPNIAWQIVFPFLATLPVLTGCRLLPVTEMSPPLTQMAIQTLDMFFNLYRKKVDSR
jgi:hypothetical protein